MHLTINGLGESIKYSASHTHTHIKVYTEEQLYTFWHWLKIGGCQHSDGLLTSPLVSCSFLILDTSVGVFHCRVTQTFISEGVGAEPSRWSHSCKIVLVFHYKHWSLWLCPTMSTSQKQAPMRQIAKSGCSPGTCDIVSHDTCGCSPKRVFVSSMLFLAPNP